MFIEVKLAVGEKEIIINTKQIVWFAADESMKVMSEPHDPPEGFPKAAPCPRWTTIVHTSDGECHRIKIGFPEFKKLVGVE